MLATAVRATDGKDNNEDGNGKGDSGSGGGKENNGGDAHTPIN